MYLNSGINAVMHPFVELHFDQPYTVERMLHSSNLILLQHWWALYQPLAIASIWQGRALEYAFVVLNSMRYALPCLPEIYDTSKIQAPLYSRHAPRFHTVDLRCDRNEKMFLYIWSYLLSNHPQLSLLLLQQTELLLGWRQSD